MSSYYDYDDTAAGGGRRWARTALIAAVALLGIVLLLFGWFDSGSDATPAGPPAPVAAEQPTATAAARPAPTGKPAVAGQLRVNEAGVLVGHRRDEAGAVAAAGNFLAALYTQSNRTEPRELQVLGSVAASPADAARMAGDLASEDRALARVLGVPDLQAPSVIAFGRPVGYRVDSYTDDAAVVDVHVAGGQGIAGAGGDSGAAGRTFFEVNRLQLRWAGGDWRLVNTSRLVNGGPDLGSVAAQTFRPFSVSAVAS